MERKRDESRTVRERIASVDISINDTPLVTLTGLLGLRKPKRRWSFDMPSKGLKTRTRDIAR